MNYELNLLSKLIKSDNPKIEWKKIQEGLDGKNLFLLYSKEFDAIIEHYEKYGKVPDKKVFRGKFPDIQLPSCQQSINFYIDEVKTAYLYSEVARINEKTVELMKEYKPVEALQYTVGELQALQAIGQVSADVNLTTTVDKRIERYAKKRKQGIVSGIPTGWIRLDQETTGWQPGDLSFILSRTGNFKSWTLVAWAVNSWIAGYFPLFFSREMGREQIARRIDAYVTLMRFKDIKTGTISDDDFKKFKDRLRKTFKDKPPFQIIDSAGAQDFRPSFIQSKIKQYKPDVVYIDGVYMLSGPSAKTDWEKQTIITRSVKQIALNEKIPIVGTTQAHREAAGKKKKIELKNFAYSDSYGQDADNVVALNRIWDPIMEQYKNEVIAELIKSRDGEIIRMHIDVDLNSMKIEEDASMIAANILESGGSGEVFTEGFTGVLEKEELLI